MRKLASIQRITKITPIPNASNIELATILGWHVAIKKGEFRPGDLVVYAEADSILPKENPDFKHLEGKRVRTEKIGNIYSQGMVFPTSILPAEYEIEKGIEEGADVTVELGVTKWDPDEGSHIKARHTTKIKYPDKWYTKSSIGKWLWEKFIYRPAAGPFPNWIYKANETRIQSLQDILNTYVGTPCEYTEKLNGASITVWFDHNKNKLRVCSPNHEIYDHKDPFFQAALKYEDQIWCLPKSIVLQGEIVGPDIQKNRYGLRGARIYFYQAWLKGVGYLQPSVFRDMMKRRGLSTVPYLGTIRLGTSIDYFVGLSVGMSELNPATKREGIIIRPQTNIYVPDDERFVGGRLSLKVINPDFLVEYNL